MTNTTVRIYTNGKSLFTLEDYSGFDGCSYGNNITIHSEVSKLKARAMHENGSLHYVFGTGNRKELKDLSISRKTKLNNFEVN